MDIKELHAIAFSHWCYDKNGNFLWYKKSSLDKNYITEEEKTEARKEFDKRKQEKIESIKPWQLVFVGMGMENDSDVWNHRIRTRIDRGNGREFFVELLINKRNWNDYRELVVDCVVDENQRKEYNKKCEDLLRYWRDNWSQSMKDDWEKYNKQPYYWYRIDEARAFLESREATKENVINFVNFIFDVKFTSMEVDNYLLTTDDFICISL